MSISFSYQKYLAAKKTVDDRALNPEVFSAFMGTLTGLLLHRPVKVLEIGAGIGTMVERILSRTEQLSLEYTALDLNEKSLQTTEQRLRKFLRNNNWRISSGAADESLTAQKGERQVTLHLIHSEALEFSDSGANQGAFDVLIAHAVLDIMHTQSAVPVLLQTLRTDGVYYFSLNYNGRTKFLPELDPRLDAQIEKRYNASMNRIKSSGGFRSGSRTGDHLLEYLSAETELLAHGDADWEVTPAEGEYPYDEAYFVRCILQTIEKALTDDPELNPEEFTDWLRTRYQQLQAGQLIFRAHHMDFFGSKR